MEKKLEIEQINTNNEIGQIDIEEIKIEKNEIFQIDLEQNSNFENSFYQKLSDRKISRKYECQYCDYSAGRKDHLRRHMGKHTGDKRHICNECGYCTYRSDHLKRHQLQHQTTPTQNWLKCDHCQSYSTSRKDHLTRHKLTCKYKNNLPISVLQFTE